MGKLYNGGKNYGEDTESLDATYLSKTDAASTYIPSNTNHIELTDANSDHYTDITNAEIKVAANSNIGDNEEKYIKTTEEDIMKNPDYWGYHINNPSEFSQSLNETLGWLRGNTSCIKRSVNGVDIEGEWENGWGYNASDASQYAGSLYDFLGWVRDNITGIDGKITYDEQDDQIEISEAISVDGSVTVDHDLIKGGSHGYWGYQASPQAHSTSLDSFASWVLDSFDSLDGITYNTSSGYYSIDGMIIYDDDIVTSNVDGWGYHATASEYSTSLGETIQWLRENISDDGTIEIGNGDVILNSDAQGTSYWTETDQSHSLYTTLHGLDSRISGYITNYGNDTQDVVVSGDIRTEDYNGWGYYEGEDDDTSLKCVISDILSRLSTLENG